MIRNIEANEVIGCDSYVDICDFNYDHHNLDSSPESGVIHVPTDQLDVFFQKNGDNGKEYTLVSSKSDFGAFYQNQSPVWMDMSRWLTMVPYLENSNMQSLGYNDITIPTRCNIDRCKPNDKYSIKCWSFTNATFPSIPNNIKKWYLVNSMIDEAQGIPFGIMPGTEEKTVSSYNENKTEVLYVNFQLNNSERMTLLSYFNAAQLNWVTVRTVAIPFEEYLNEMAKHKFILCPDGNGPDCYRTWEALYLGCVPILSRSKATSYFDDLPVLFLDSDDDITRDFLEDKYDEIISKDWNMEKITKSYWRDRIRAGYDSNT